MSGTTETAAAVEMCECGREVYRHGRSRFVGGRRTFEYPCGRLAEIDAWVERGRRPSWRARVVAWCADRIAWCADRIRRRAETEAP